MTDWKTRGEQLRQELAQKLHLDSLTADEAQDIHHAYDDADNQVGFCVVCELGKPWRRHEAPQDSNLNKPGAPNANSGHGHVYPRPDGMRARCGGPRMCKRCALDAARKSQAAHQT